MRFGNLRGLLKRCRRVWRMLAAGLGLRCSEYPQAERLRVALVAARGVDAGAVASGLPMRLRGLRMLCIRSGCAAVESAIA